MENLIQKVMSRPFRTWFALCLLAFFVGLSGCDTIYRPVYSNRKNYFQTPVAMNQKGQPELSAEQVLKGLPETPAGPADAGALPPPPPPAAPDAAPPAPPAVPPPPQ